LSKRVRIALDEGVIEILKERVEMAKEIDKFRITRRNILRKQERITVKHFCRLNSIAHMSGRRVVLLDDDGFHLRHNDSVLGGVKFNK
jgi:hypothetical protein